MIDNEVFMNVETLGDLYIYDVLLTFIYPRVFVCEDVYSCKYLFYEMSSDADVDTWLVSKITKKEYYDLVDKKKTLQSVYRKRLNRSVFSVSKHYSESDRIDISYDIKNWIEMLPSKDAYAEKEVIDDVEQETLKAARETGNTTFDIRLYPGTDRHSVPKKILEDLCSAITPMIGAISGKRGSESLQVATAPGSCIVRFSFEEQMNLFNESGSTKDMQVLNSVFVKDLDEQGLDIVKDKKKFVNAYTKFLYAIKRTGSDVQLTTAFPNATSVKRIDLSRAIIKERYDRTKDIYDIKEEIKNENGILIALDTKQNTFKLLLEDGNIKSGALCENFISDKVYEIPKEYSATVCEKKIICKHGENGKKEYTLLELA